MSGVTIRVRSDSRQARKDLSNLERSVANIDKTVKGVSSAFKTLALSIGSAFAATAVTKGINNATDSLTSLENRIALVTGRGKELNQQMDAIFSIAKATRQPVDAAAETFNRFGIALQESGKSVAEINVAIEAVGRAAAISGGSAESIRAALFQLGQGLASGQLRGQELNSVLEQAPEIARVIANDLQVPFGSLRKLAEEGKITTDVVFNALVNQADALEKKFQNIEQTSGQAFVVLRDQVGRVTAEISKQLGITAAFTSRINALSNFIEQNRQAIVASVVNSARGFQSQFQGIIAIARGVSKILTVIIGRFADAIPRITTPFRDFAQVLYGEVAGGFLFASALIKRFGLDIEGAFRKITDTRFAGVFREIFSAKSLKEFGDALYRLGEVLDRYGRRWYNFGNLTDRFSRSARVYLYETGVFLGLIDRQLIRLRYTSFERLSKAGSVLADALSQVKRNIAASDFFVLIQISILKSIQLFKAYSDAIFNLLRIEPQKGFDFLSNSFESVYRIANNSLSRTTKIIKDFGNTVKRTFLDIYDKVIGNSYWTDTMEGTYSLAADKLNKTKDLVKNFASEVSGYVRKIYDSLNSPVLSSSTTIDITIGNIKAKAGEISKFLNTTGTEIATGIAEKLRSGITRLQDISPRLAGIITVAVTAGLTRALSPSLFAKTFGKLGPLLFVTVGAALINAFDGVVLKTGFFQALANGVGQAIGEGLNTIVENIPQILKALIQLATAFGRGLQETLKNSLIGLPAQILSFIPGGSLLTTILYGTLGAAVFFSGVRKILISNVKSLLTSVGKLQGKGLLYNLFVGSDPNNLKTTILGTSKSAIDGFAKQAALQNRKAGIAALARIGTTIVGAEVLLGGFLGTTGAAIAGIGASVVQEAIIGNPQRVAAFMALFNGTLATARAKLLAFSSSLNIGSSLSAIFASFSANAISSLKGLVAFNKIAALDFSKSWKIASIASGSSIAQVVGKYKGAVLKGAGLAVLLGTFFTTAANAAEDGAESTGTSLSEMFAYGVSAALLFADQIAALLGKLGKLVLASFKRLFVGFGGVVKTAALTLGRVILTSLTSAGAAIAGVAAGIPLITGSFLVAAATITTAGIGGIIYSAFFGEGDTFLERVKSNFEGVLAFFGLLNKSVADVRKESLKTLKNIEKLVGKEFNINLSTKLEDIDLSKASDRNLLKIEKAVNNLDRNRLKADQEVAAFGSVSEETRKAIKAAVNQVEVAIREGGSGESTTNAAISTLRDTFIADLDSRDSTVVTRGLSKLVNNLFGTNVNQAKIFAKELKTILEDPRFSGENAFDNPSVAKAFADNILGKFPDLDVLPGALRALLVQISNTGRVEARVADALVDLKASENPELLAKILFQDTGLSLPEQQLKDLIKAIEIQSKINSAAVLVAEQQKIADVTSKVVGEEVSLTQVQALLDLGDMAEIRDLVKEISKIEKQFEAFGSDIDDPKVAQQIIAAAQGSKEVNDLYIRLRQAQEELKAITVQSLSFTLEPGTIKDINEQLQKAGVDGLSTALGEIFSSDFKDNQVGRFALDQNLRRLEDLRAKRARMLAEGSTALDQQDAKINALTQSIQFQVKVLNSKVLAETQGLSLLEEAASLVENRDIGLNDLLKLDNATIKKIAEAQEKLIGLKIIADEFGKTPLVGSVIAGFTKDQVEGQITAVQKLIQELFKGIGKTTGKDSETIMEKIVGRLNDLGFSYDLSTVASLSNKTLQSINKSLNSVNKAQKDLTNSNLKDNAARQASIKIIEEQRKKLFDLLTQGTVQQVAPAIEAIGGDVSLITNQKTLDLTVSIYDLQQKLLNTSFRDVEARRQINSELELQSQLLDGITNQAETASLRMRDSISSGLKTLIKEGGSIQDFFDTFLDSLSNQIIDTVVDAFVQSFFETAGLKEMFDNLFSGLFSSSHEVGKRIGQDTKAGFDDSAVDMGPDSGFFGGLMKGLTGFLGALKGGIGSALNSLMQGLQGGFGGGGGGIGSLIQTGLSLFGFMNEGGIVPRTPYSRDGIDSVPTMLTPGELVVPANKVDNFMRGMSGSTQQFNINVSGDVSRQTRKEIVRMIPEITSGVNITNKENNYRR